MDMGHPCYVNGRVIMVYVCEWVMYDVKMSVGHLCVDGQQLAMDHKAVEIYANVTQARQDSNDAVLIDSR